jgi:CRISPR-associated endonuclease/helicase Cas3
MKSQYVLSFWAKKSEDDKEHYPLLYHMLDTFGVCYEIWERCLHVSARRSIANAIGFPELGAARWVSLWVGLHDIGKASPDFQ